MLARKHIRAPRSFDPGPGLPRERLAYLSEAEMEALRLATDGTVNRGPRGIPSFAVTSGKESGTTMGGGEKTKDNPSGGGPGGPFGANSGPSTSSATKSASGSGGQGSGGSHPASGASPGSTATKSTASASSAPAASKAPSSSTPSRSPSAASSAAPASPMGGQGTSFSSSAAASAANKAASLRSGAPTVSPMGGQGTSFSKPAAAEAANRATASATKGGMNPSGSSKTASAMATANTRSYPGMGVTAPAPNGDMMAPNAGTDFNRTLRSLGQDLGQPNPNFDNSPTTFGNWATDSYGRISGIKPGDPEAQSKWSKEIAKTIAGEAAGESLIGQAAVAKAMQNRMAYGEKYGRTKYGNFDKPEAMLDAFDANGYRKASTQNDEYRQAAPGTASYSRAAAAMADSLDPYGNLATEHPDALDKTNYLTSDLEASPKAPNWARNDAWNATRTQIGNHVFGNPDDNAEKVATANQERMPAAAARTQAYNAANPAAEVGALHPASYSVPSTTLSSTNRPRSASAAEEMVRRDFVNQQLGDLVNDPVVNRGLVNGIGNGMWNTRISDATRVAQGGTPVGAWGERDMAPWDGAGFRTPDQAQQNVDSGYGVSANRSFHSYGLAGDITVPRQEGETTAQWENRNAAANAELARNIDPASGVTWGGSWRNPDPSHFQLGSGYKVAEAVAKYGSPVSSPGVRPAGYETASAVRQPDQYRLSEGGIYNAMKSLPGAISGLGRGFKSFSDAVSTPNPVAKGFLGAIGSGGSLGKGLATVGFNNTAAPSIKGAISSGIQSLKDTFDPNNPRAQQAPNYSGSMPTRAPTSGSVRNDQTSERRGERGASATKSGRKGESKDGGREMIQPKRATVATSKGRVGRKRIEDLATPDATAPNPWDYFTNVITKEQALRQLLGEDWYNS